MARTAPTSRIRGRIQAYDCATLDAIDAHIAKLASSWASISEPATDTMRADYWADVDLLLDKRAELQP